MATAPIRKLDVFLDRLPDFASVHVPSVGFDFGTAFVRAAVVYRRHKSSASASDADAGVGVSLSTFAKADAATALRYAAARLDDSSPNSNELKVYFTGQTTSEDEQQIKDTFPNASMTRRDKLNCHAKGVHFLVSTNLAEEELYHDASKTNPKTEEMVAFNQKLRAFSPPKMMEVLNNMNATLDARKGAKFPLTLTLVGSNLMIFTIEKEASFQLVDARSEGGFSMKLLWEKVCPPNCKSDFESFLQYAEKGNRRGVDSVVRDMVEATDGMYDIFPKDCPILNFGKLENLRRNQVKPEDMARGLVGWHTDSAIMKSDNLAMLAKTYTIYFCGSLAQLEMYRHEVLQRAYVCPYGVILEPKFIKTDATAALGACCNDCQL